MSDIRRHFMKSAAAKHQEEQAAEKAKGASKSPQKKGKKEKEDSPVVEVKSKFFGGGSSGGGAGGGGGKGGGAFADRAKRKREESDKAKDDDDDVMIIEDAQAPAPKTSQDTKKAKQADTKPQVKKEEEAKKEVKAEGKQAVKDESTSDKGGRKLPGFLGKKGAAEEAKAAVAKKTKKDKDDEDEDADLETAKAPAAKKARKAKDDDEDDDDFEAGRRGKGGTNKDDRKPFNNDDKAAAADKTPPSKKRDDGEGDDEGTEKKKKFNWYAMQASKAPVANAHLKDEKIAAHPGSDSCLAGLTFVITGVLDSLEREEAQDLIQRYGGKVTGSVSGKTSYLLAGKDPGESKMKKVQPGKTKVINEDQLFELIDERTAKGGAPAAAAGAGAAAAAKTPAKAAAAAKKASPAKVEVQSVKVQECKDKGKKEGKAAAAEGKGEKKEADKSSATPAKGTPHSAGKELKGIPQLWVDKYKPQGRADIIGNGGEVNKLEKWLACWGSDEKKAAELGKVPHDKKRDLEKLFEFKAALLSGPPGVGKSSAATICARAAGYDVVEMNASDCRNAKGLKENLFVTTNQSLQGFFTSSTSSSSSQGSHKQQQQHVGSGRTCLIMDEVDGMSGGDRGGTSELIEMIKKSRAPIICICNDAFSTKLKSLKNYCLELKFGKPNKLQVAKRVADIATQEGFSFANPAVVEKIVESCGNDVRHIINVLQTWRLKTNTLAYGDVANELSRGGKEQSTLQTSPFDVCNDWFLDSSKNARASVGDRQQMFFYDSDLMPLFVQENYLKTATQVPYDTAMTHPEKELHVISCMARAADSISDGDVVNNKIRGAQHWALMPLHGVLSCVRAGAFVRGSPGGFRNMDWRRIAFPKTLGFMSTMNKRNRLLGDIERGMKLHTSACRREVGCDMLPLIRTKLTLPLAEKGEEGVDEVIGLMDDYYWTKEEYDSIVTELRLPDKISPDPLSGVDSKVKAALTRRYNKESHSIAFSRGKASTGALAVKGGKKANIGMSGEVEKEEEDDEDDDEEAAGDEDDDEEMPKANTKAGGRKGQGARGEQGASKASKASDGGRGSKKASGGGGGSSRGGGGGKGGGGEGARSSGSFKGGGGGKDAGAAGGSSKGREKDLTPKKDAGGGGGPGLLAFFKKSPK